MTAARPRRAARLALAAGLAGFAAAAPAETPTDGESATTPAAAEAADEAPAPAAPAPAADPRAELARIRAELGRLEARQRELRAAVAALAARLAEPEAEAAGPEAAAAAADAAGPAATETAAEETGPAAAPAEAVRASAAARYRDPAPRLFDRARAAFAESNYYDAARLFGEFLERYPAHEQAAHARYWLGETRYAQGQFRGAVEEFETLLAGPAGPWHPVARLKIGYAWFELGDYARARAVLTELRDAEPGGNIARLAQLRLERLARLAPESSAEP